jgi:acyl-coenzyme A synthetase/AMP-(fatty) acid ligase
MMIRLTFGLKVHPEEVGAVIDQHPEVQLSHVRARNNPITGSIVVADVVLKAGRTKWRQTLSGRNLNTRSCRCSGSLARHNPLYFVPALNFSVAGNSLVKS